MPHIFITKPNAKENQRNWFASPLQKRKRKQNGKLIPRFSFAIVFVRTVYPPHPSLRPSGATRNQWRYVTLVQRDPPQHQAPCTWCFGALVLLMADNGGNWMVGLLDPVNLGAHPIFLPQGRNCPKKFSGPNKNCTKKMPRITLNYFRSFPVV